MTDVKQEFVDMYQPYAERAALLINNPKVNSSHILSMWAQETGWGKSLAGTNNLGGIKPNGQFANYTTLDEFVTSYASVMNKIVANKPGDNFFQKLENGFYEGYDKTPNVTYAKSVLKVWEDLPVLADKPSDGGSWLQQGMDWIKKNFPPDQVVIATPDNPNPTKPTPPTSGGGFGFSWDGFFKGIGGYGNKVGMFILGIVGLVIGFYLLSKGEGKSE